MLTKPPIIPHKNPAQVGPVNLFCMNFVQSKRVMVAAQICGPSGAKSKIGNKEQDVLGQNPSGSACVSKLLPYRSLM
jgi:hypothetical protein